MDHFLNIINHITRTLLGVPIVDLFHHATESKIKEQEAYQLAQKKQLAQAIRVGRQIIALWSLKPNFIEKFYRKIALGNLLDNLNQALKNWQDKIKSVTSMRAKAKAYEAADQQNPLDISSLSEAITIYQKCLTIVDDPQILESLNNCQAEIKRRQKFKNLVKAGKQQANQKFYKQALASFTSAQEIFKNPDIEKAINTCLAYIETEEKYEIILKKVLHIATQGQFQKAINVLESTLERFRRSDGEQILSDLIRIVNGQKTLRAGLLAEQSGELEEASIFYQQSSHLLPELELSKIRLSIISIKLNKYQEAINYLQSLSGEQANYLRGLAHAKMGNYDQAEQEWRPLNHPQIKQQLNQIKTLSNREKLHHIRQIQDQVATGKIAEAHSASLSYFEKFGENTLIKTNLIDHIQPRLEANFWNQQNWTLITQQAQKTWRQNQDITSLHNLAIATYYQAQLEPDKILDWIMLGFSAIANIPLDPILQNIPWLGITPVDIDSFTTSFIELAETTIELIKNKDITTYLNIRDHYRQDIIALKLIPQHPHCAIKLNNLYLTPSYCQKTNSLPLQIPRITHQTKIEGKILLALYSNFGKAVAACYHGDIPRAIQIKPVVEVKNNTDRFALAYISYHEGCHHLQQQEWRKAVAPLKRTNLELKTNLEWRKQIDKLCEYQRQTLSTFEELLEFTQFWYDTVKSKAAKSYLAEYKSRQICQNLLDNKILTQQALNQLEELLKLDSSNPIVKDLINKIKFDQEAQQISQLLNQGKFIEAINLAKKSKNLEIRHKMALICLEQVELLHNQLSSPPDLDKMEQIRHLVNLAYELYPEDPMILQFHQMCH